MDYSLTTVLLWCGGAGGVSIGRGAHPRVGAAARQAPSKPPKSEIKKKTQIV
jgi:hypothetical protein